MSGGAFAPGIGPEPFTLPAIDFPFIIAFATLAFFNVIELSVIIFTTFKRYRGWYFYSTLLSTWGIMLYTLGYLFKYYNIIHNDVWNCAIFVTGWFPMVTGFALVLWSRLHLVVKHQSHVTTAVLIMIGFSLLVLQVPVAILSFGAETLANKHYLPIYNIWEKVQIVGICIQELIISGIYIYCLRTMSHVNDTKATRQLFWHAIAVQLLVIVLDLAMLGIEFGGLFIIYVMFKAAIYGIKLKAEFLILTRLRNHLVQGSISSSHPRPSTAPTSMTGRREAYEQSFPTTTNRTALTETDSHGKPVVSDDTFLEMGIVKHGENEKIAAANNEKMTDSFADSDRTHSGDVIPE